MEHSFASGASKTGFPLFPRCISSPLGNHYFPEVSRPEVGPSALAETGLLCMVRVISNRRLSRGLSQDRILAGSLVSRMFGLAQGGVARKF